MKLIVIGKNNKARLNKFIEIALYLGGYLVALLLAQFFFDSIVVDDGHRILVSFIAVCLIYLLDKTIKPILVHFAIPITAITMGLFYFVINTAILKLVDVIMSDWLDFSSIWRLFFISIALSAVNMIIESFIIKPIMRGFKHE